MRISRDQNLQFKSGQGEVGSKAYARWHVGMKEEMKKLLEFNGPEKGVVNESSLRPIECRQIQVRISIAFGHIIYE